MIVTKESLHSCLDEMKPLLFSHWEEVAAYKNQIPYDPQFDKYLALEDAGVCHTYILRKEGVMVGYSVYFLTPHMHYKHDVYANNDIVFVLPEFRGANTVTFLKLIEQDLKEEQDVSVIMYHMKVYAEFHGLMKHLGYDHMEHLYTKYVGEM